MKNLVLKDVPCEEKLAEIRKLLGMPQIESEDLNSESEVSNSESTKQGEGTERAADGQELSRIEEESEVDDRKKSIERILEGFKGKTIKLAQIILREIEKSASLRWNYDSLEIVIDSEPVLHSNIKLLLEKILEQRSPTFPLGLHKFINALIGIKLPQVYFRGSDAKNIREFLLNIQGNSVVNEPGESRKREREGEEEDEAQIIKRIRREVNEPEASPSEGETGIKRQRSESGDSERGVKRSRSDSFGEEGGTSEEAGPSEEPKAKKKRQKRVFEFTGDPPRRSGRKKLKAEIGRAWSALDDKDD